MPRIKTTRTVTIALFVLRIYLVAMVVIIAAKFIIEARHWGNRNGSAAATAAEK
jgi:hypothetical protein